MYIWLCRFSLHSAYYFRLVDMDKEDKKKEQKPRLARVIKILGRTGSQGQCTQVNIFPYDFWLETTLPNFNKPYN